MPRARRGGARTGAVGTAYGNRSDLNGGAAPIATAPNQTYGAAAAQAAAQQKVRMGTPSLPQSAAPQAGGGMGVTAGGQAPPVAPAQGPVPGADGAFLRPTERPAEPVTAGLPSGPGPGPGVLNTMGMAQSSLGDLLSQMANAPHATPEVQALASYVSSGSR